MSTTQKNRPNVQGTEEKKENEKVIAPTNGNGAHHANGKTEIKLLLSKNLRINFYSLNHYFQFITLYLI